jgi:hypothetical protein
LARLAIIAGAGDLPHIAMREALSQGEDPLFFSITESDFTPGEFLNRTIPVYITQIGKIFKPCKKNNGSGDKRNAAQPFPVINFKIAEIISDNKSVDEIKS